MNEREIIKALDVYFNRENPPKFINVSRIPLICQDIKTIRETLVGMHDDAKEKNGDYESRIRKLEYRQAYWAGGAAIFSVLGMWILEHFFKI